MKWVTREKIKVDRVACPWLIQHFVDPAAEFLFLEDTSVNFLIAVALGWSAIKRARLGMCLAGILLIPGVATLMGHPFSRLGCPPANE